jgi:hypothetical protein
MDKVSGICSGFLFCQAFKFVRSPSCNHFCYFIYRRGVVVVQMSAFCILLGVGTTTIVLLDFLLAITCYFCTLGKDLTMCENLHDLDERFDGHLFLDLLASVNLWHCLRSKL